MSLQIIDVCVVLTVKLLRCGKSRSRDSQPRNPNDAQHAPACFFVCMSLRISELWWLRWGSRKAGRCRLGRC
ncbi:hypothetical protein YDC107_5418 [Escherichia phage YDC107_1]|nr:hypothetical protein YDC107_5405 [Escherichia phage YDC107_1]AUO37535.1 hypothetical protein YDC107_5418 [Escherichia phage YDC107_1]